MDLAGRTAVVTGGASGIGAELCRRFVAEGASVLVVDRDGVGAERVADEIGQTAFTADVGDEAGNIAFVRHAEETFGHIDLLVLNAGIGVGGGVEASDEDWDRAWRVNTMSHVWAVRAALPAMLERGEGTLLHTASAAGLLSNIGAAPYSVTKHATVALAEWLSITHGAQGITVHCLCPQFVRTPLLDEADGIPGLDKLVQMGVVEPQVVSEAVVQALRDGTFLILPHPEVAAFEQARAGDREGWLSGMRRLQRSVFG